MIKLTNLLNEKQLKEVFFEGLFENKVIKYAHTRDGKYLDFSLACTNQALDKFFNRLFNKYKKKNSHMDFMSECMYWTNVAVQRFQVRDEGSWAGMIDGTDTPNIGRIITNIKTTVENEIIRYINDGVKYAKKTIDGERKHVKYKFNLTSLDSLMMGAEGEETTLVNSVGEDMGYWTEKEGYQASHFSQWFEENKDRILTKSQVRLLDNLKKCQHQQDGYTSNDIFLITGVSDKNLATYMKRIRERVLKAFENENPMGHKTQLQLHKEAEIELWTPLVYLVYSDDVEGQNTAISNWLLANFNNEKVNNIIYDNCSKDDSIAVTYAFFNQSKGAVIPSKLLYKIIAMVEARLDYLQAMDTTSVKFYKKESEMGRWTPQAHKDYAEQLKSFTQQECLVYDSKGNLLRTESWKPFNSKDKHIYEVSPLGSTVKVITE